MNVKLGYFLSEESLLILTMFSKIFKAFFVETNKSSLENHFLL